MKRGVLQSILQFCLTKCFPSFCYIPSLFSSFFLEHYGAISPGLLKKVFMQVHVLFWVFTFSYFHEGCPVPFSLINCFATIFSKKPVPYIPSSSIMCHHLFTARWFGDKSVTEKCLMKPQDTCITSPYLQVFSAGWFLEFLLNPLKLNNLKKFKALRDGKGGRNEMEILLASIISKYRYCYRNHISGKALKLLFQH